MKDTKTYHLFVTAFLAFAVLSTTLFSTGCPKKDNVRKAVEASYRLPGLIEDAGKKLKEGVELGVVSIELKDKITGQLITANTAVKAYIPLVREVNEMYERREQVPQSKLDALNRIFRFQVLAAVLDVFESARLITGENGQFIMLAFLAAKNLVMEIASSFNIKPLPSPKPAV